MVKKYFRLTEVVNICEVSEDFVLSLERERLVKSVKRRRLKLFPVDQVDRIRVAHVLINEMGVNLAGVEVALHMREQLINIRREHVVFLRRLGRRS
jgi:MerR family transcriptional regulator, heat shock protein HspR